MIDLTRVRYDLAILTPDGQTLHATDLARGLSWEEQPGELAQRITIDVQNIQLTDGRRLHQVLPNGGRVYINADWGEGWKEVARGTVIRRGNREDPLPHITRTAYDQLFQLQRSQDERYYAPGTDVAAIITDILQGWSVPIGSIDGPSIQLADNVVLGHRVRVSEQIFRGHYLSEMIAEVLRLSKLLGAGLWIMRSDQGKVSVIKAGSNQPVYHFGPDVLQSVDDEEDLEAFVTRVKVVGTSSDTTTAREIVAQVDGRTDWGVFQEIISEPAADDPATAEQAAQETIDQRGRPRQTKTFVGPDFPPVRKGDLVRIQTSMVDDSFLVAGVHHDAVARTMSMQVVTADAWV